MSLAKRGDKCYLWQGGKTYEIYPQACNRKFKEYIRNRDEYKCWLCDKTEEESGSKLSDHHIDSNKKNNNELNHIILCRSCNIKVIRNRNKWEKYFNKLIKKRFKGTEIWNNPICGEDFLREGFWEEISSKRMLIK